MLTSAEIAAIAAKALDDKKARDIKVLKTDKQTVLADYFVICNGTSSTHIKALVDEVDKQLSEAGEPPIRREGLRSDIWVPLERCGGGRSLIPSAPLITGASGNRFYKLKRD